MIRFDSRHVQELHSFRHFTQTSFWVHFCRNFVDEKRVEALRWLLSSIQFRDYERLEIYLRSSIILHVAYFTAGKFYAYRVLRMSFYYQFIFPYSHAHNRCASVGCSVILLENTFVFVLVRNSKNHKTENFFIVGSPVRDKSHSVTIRL
jgi:hypothetical protein